MTHDDLRDLLDASAGTPPRDLDPDALLATAGRRRTTRLGAGLLAGTAVALAGVLVVPNLLPTPQRATPGAPTPSTASTPEPGDATPGATGIPCPEPTVPRADDPVIDYVDLVVWGGRTYVQPEPDPGVYVLGEVIGEVSCRYFAVMSEDGTLREPGPWPDGTATYLPEGTLVREVDGHDPRCWLGAFNHGAVRVFRAQDPDVTAPRPAPGCEGPAPTPLTGHEADAQLALLAAEDAAWRANR